MPLTQTGLVDEVANGAKASRADTKRVLATLEEIVLDHIPNAEKIKIGGVVQLDVRVRRRPSRDQAVIRLRAKPAP